MIVVNLIEDIVMRQIADTRGAMSGESKKELDRRNSEERKRLRKEMQEKQPRGSSMTDERGSRGRRMSRKEKAQRDLYVEATLNKPARLRRDSELKPSSL